MDNNIQAPISSAATIQIIMRVLTENLFEAEHQMHDAVVIGDRKVEYGWLCRINAIKSIRTDLIMALRETK